MGQWEYTHASKDALGTRLTDWGEHGHGGSSVGGLISGFGFGSEVVTGCDGARWCCCVQFAPALDHMFE